jgi:Tol biopolymer transport system component
MRTRRALLRLLPAVALTSASLLAASRAGAQNSYFGQNQVQYQKFEWRVKKSDHFDVHYYKGMEEGAIIAARMAERSYARLSRIMGYTFKERKPIIMFASRGDFAQNNVTGDLGEQTGGVTDASHQRNMFFFGQDLAEVEHVLTHEMVHQFQYDIIFRGRTGTGLQNMTVTQPPYWFAEGMAEYLSIGPDHPATDAIIRDAALNGNIPSVQKMTDRPDLYFPYRYGESFWRYIGQRWGDEIIGEIMLATPTLGIERAFKRHTGFDLDELGDEWRDAMQTKYLPAIANLERPRKIAQPLLNARKTGGIIPIYVAPALSPDGRQIAYISTGSLLRAEVFLDLYLADATNGKRLKRLTNSTLNPEFEELRTVYSQSAFSPDGRHLAFTAYRKGKDVLDIVDVKSQEIERRLDTPLSQMVGPSWSPDGKRIVFSGAEHGFSNLYMIDADGRNLRQLTSGKESGLQPSWSPDGRQVAFVSDRGQGTNLELLKFGKWKINLLDLETNAITVIPGQDGKNLNPMWAPDGKSVAFISDRTGIPQVFLYDFETKEHYQLTKFIGGVQSLTENSPAMTWARQADKLAFVYFDNGDHTVWSISNPRQLKHDPYRTPAQTVAAAAAAAAAVDAAAQRATQAPPTPATQAADAAAQVARLAREALQAKDTTNGRRQSVYRTPSGLRTSSDLPAPGTPGAQSPVSVAALLDSAALALPPETAIKDEPYHPSLRAEYISRPSVGYAQDNYGKGVYGGTAIVLGDLIGNRQLVLAGSINGRLEEAQVFTQYSNFGNRLNYTIGLTQQPIFYFGGGSTQDLGNGQFIQFQSLDRLIVRQASYAGLYPINRFNRFEVGASFINVDRSREYISRGIDYNAGYATGYYVDSIRGLGSLNYGVPTVAYVSDNALFNSTGPFYGHRYRMQVSPYVGKQGFMNYLADLRRYDAVIFSLLTFATRFYADISDGPGEQVLQKYIGYPDYIHGYDRENYTNSCDAASGANCVQAATQLLGTRVMVANAELRFPLIRRFDLGVIPIALPPIDGHIFYDAGMAWTAGQSISLTRPDNYDLTKQRYPLRSYGYGVRMNLFNIAILRWDYSVPRDSFNKKGYWWFSLGPSF